MADHGVKADLDFANLAYGPEQLFGVRSLTREDARVHGKMTKAGAAGEIGVLIDDVMGNAILAARPPQHWSVSTEIAVDFVGGLWPTDVELSAKGWLVDSSPTGGLALGTVATSTGVVVAHCRQRGRFIPLSGDLDTPPPHIPGRDSDISGAYAVVDVGDGVVETTVMPNLCNPLGNLHGGVALAISERLASQPHAGRPTLRTTSIHVAYLRPIPRGTSIRFSIEHIHDGRSLAVSHVTSRTLDGKACTVATVVRQ